MTEASITERHFARLAAVARATRQDWAAQALASPQTAPYKWAVLAEVVGLRQLRAEFELSDVAVVWPQIRADVRNWTPLQPAAVLVDLVTLRALWCPGADEALQQLQRQSPLQLIDLAVALQRASDGFAVAAPSSRLRRGGGDELAGKRRARKVRRSGG